MAAGPRFNSSNRSKTAGVNGKAKAGPSRALATGIAPSKTSQNSRTPGKAPPFKAAAPPSQRRAALTAKDASAGNGFASHNPNGNGRANGNGKADSGAAKPEPKILFQKFFKSVGPRTYAAQVKELANGNHLLVLTEGKRDADSDEVRKTRLFVYGEDFSQFFRLLHETATFIRANPLSEEVRTRRDKFWAKKNHRENGNGSDDR